MRQDFSFSVVLCLCLLFVVFGIFSTASHKYQLPEILKKPPNPVAKLMLPCYFTEIYSGFLNFLLSTEDWLEETPVQSLWTQKTVEKQLKNQRTKPYKGSEKPSATSPQSTSDWKRVKRRTRPLRCQWWRPGVLIPEAEQMCNKQEPEELRPNRQRRESWGREAKANSPHFQFNLNILYMRR